MSPRQPPEEPLQTNPEDAEPTGTAGHHGGGLQVEGAPPKSAEAGLPEEDLKRETMPEEPGVVHQTIEKLKYIATRPQF